MREASSPASMLSEMSLAGFTAALQPDPLGGNNEGKSYPDLLRDDQVHACFQQRRLAVVSTKWSVEPGGEDSEDKRAAEALNDNLQALQFDDICDQMLYGVFYGRGVAEVIWELDGSLVRIADIRPRDPFRFRHDAKRRLLLQEGMAAGRRMPAKKFWLLYRPGGVGSLGGGQGLAYYLYWPVYIKRNALSFWATFAEKFSSPSVKGIVPPMATEAEKQELLRACGTLGSEAAVVIPEGMQIELLEATRRGGGDYKEFVAAMNQAISKVILSQTMTTDDGSSRAQAVVHETVRDKIVKSDAELLCESFNRSAVKWWAEWNFPNAKPPRVLRRMKEVDDLNARVARDAQLMDRGFVPDDEYIKRHYGEGWRRLAPAAKPQGFASDGGEDEAPSDEWQPQWQLLGEEAAAEIERLAKVAGSLAEFADKLAGALGVPQKTAAEIAATLMRRRLKEAESGD